MADIASLGIAVDSKQVKDAQKALDDMAQSGGRAETSTKALATATDVLAGFTRRLVAAYSGLKIAEYVKDATLLHARYETLGVAMNIVGRNAGYTAAQMEAAAIGLQKTGITMVESRQQILRLVSAQIDLNKASELARIAQNAAVIGNMNSSQAFAHMIHGISTAQPEVLRTIGLNVSMERAYAAMAKTLGVTTNQLTQTQKTQAILNAVMKEGEGIAGVYEAAMGTAGKQLNSMQRYVENLKLILGETFNEALVIAVESVTSGLKSMNDEAQDLAIKGQLRQWGRDAIMVAAQIVDGLRLVINSFIQTGKEIVMVAEITKLALKGQFSSIREVVEARSKERDSFLQNLNLMQRTAAERFALVDKERENAKATQATTKATTANTQSLETNTEETKKSVTAYETVIKAIREKIAVQELELMMGKALTDAQTTAMDAMVKLRDGGLQLTEAKKIELATELERLATVEKSVAGMKFAKEAGDSLLSSSQSQVMNLREQVEAGRLNNAMLSMTNQQIIAVTGSKELELAANVRVAAQYAGPLHDAYIRHANDLEQMAKMQKELVSQQQIAKTAQEWERIGTSIEQTGKTAFVQFAAHGTNAAKSIGQALKTSVIDLIYQLTARPILLKIGTSITGALTSGMANAAGGAIGGGANIMGLLSSGSSIFSALSGGIASGLSSMVTGIGGAIGSSAVSAFGAGIGMSTTAAAAGAAELGAVGLGSIGGAMSMGATMGAIAGPLAIAAIVDIGARLLAGDKTVSKSKAWKTASAIPIIGIIPNIVNGLFGNGPKKFGDAELTGDFQDDGFHGEFQADWKRKTGLFSWGKKRGRRGLGIEDAQVESLNDLLFGLIDQFDGFVEHVGGAERSLNNWNFAVKHKMATEEDQAKLTLELANSIATNMIPELVALQQKGEEIVATLGRVKAEFDLTEKIIDITGQTFSTFGIASLAVRDSLVNALGGLQNAGSVLQPFFENFYTEEERAASASRLLTKELNNLGVGTIPATREQYRALVEMQDLNTESGQRMFAALVGFSPVFASITKATEDAADDMESEAERIRNSFKVLGTESFATLFEYNKYIQLARNAGIKAAEPESVFGKDAAQEQYFFPSLAVGTNELPADMVINAHRGERIIPAADNRALMGALSGRNEEMRELIAQVKRLREENRAHALALAKNTSKTARILDKFDVDGMPPARAT